MQASNSNLLQNKILGSQRKRVNLSLKKELKVKLQERGKMIRNKIEIMTVIKNRKIQKKIQI